MLMEHLKKIRITQISIAIIVIALIIFVMVPVKIHKKIFSTKNMISYAILTVTTLILNTFLRSELHAVLPSVRPNISWILCFFAPVYMLTLITAMFKISTRT